MTFNRRGGYAENVCCFFDGKATKVAEFDHPRLLFIKFCKGSERIVECNQLGAAFNGAINVFIQGELLKVLTSLLSVVLTSVINQETSHYLRRDSKEVSPILPVDPRLVHQTEIGFMNQSRRLQSVIGTFPAEVIRRKLSQFIVDDG
jgi:hypothetical protein